MTAIGLDGYQDARLTFQLNPQPKGKEAADLLAEEMASVVVSLNAAYKLCVQNSGGPDHSLTIVSLTYPNTGISIKGLGEPIRLLIELFRAIPEIVVNLCTIREKIAERRMEINLRTEYMNLVASAIKECQKAPAEAKLAYLREYVTRRAPSLPGGPIRVANAQAN